MYLTTRFGLLGMKQGLEVWFSFLDSFNGVVFGWEELRLEAELQVHSDAAGSLGFGVYFHSHWCTEMWPQDWVT